VFSIDTRHTGSDVRAYVDLTVGAPAEVLTAFGEACDGSPPSCDAMLVSGPTTIPFHLVGGQVGRMALRAIGSGMESWGANIRCACAQPPAIACNTSITGDTTQDASPALFCPALGAGPSHVYDVSPPFAVTRFPNYGIEQLAEVQLTPLGSAPHDLAAWHFPFSDIAICDKPQGACDAQSLGGDLTSKLLVGGDVSSTIAVAARGVGGPYRLDVSCRPSCRQSGGVALHSWVDEPTIGCNGLQNYSNGLSAVDTWGACATGLTGAETAFRLVSGRFGTHQVTLSGLTADLDLVVLSSDSRWICDPQSPYITSSIHAGTADETVTFDAMPGKQYWIVVDGRDGASSNYDLDVVCP